ncbi:rhodanese-like domain-containing protein [Paenibacillus terrae]|uniref:rhodanese-like domain-containing protein n=1 Tax=Paenibacillus terrae TaxID=159743 RepID=UPI0022859F2F|nr:rhodanese-like domain-containing protein [Paenibacillus terrae]
MGAVNYFWKEALNEKGTFKNAQQLEQHFASLDRNADIIVYCGSGVAACYSPYLFRYEVTDRLRLCQWNPPET